MFNTEEIQSKFFRSGPYTHLWIDKRRWRYTFMDLGMCHTIDGEYASEDEEEPSKTFGGKYKDFVRELHANFIENCTCKECEEENEKIMNNYSEKCI